ncbi:nose resistant to fluoxetine protein 6 isoform X1 [Pieris rapae]|uniref:nose resistant to fluoxetine protein 6 isoform X1 n=1 Tax=Pieris rapae TaxID=64459 RepID=UPI001E27D031|nr:nose resistant to fluoxetine protein 6 isoform X1 [Pieris rapae]
MKYFIILSVVHICNAVIYKLNDTELDRFPPVYYLDDYDKCLRKPNAVYCTVDAYLVSDAPSDLLTIIKEYSQHRHRHFNHSYITYGICLSSTCNNYTNLNRKQNLEKCLNETLLKDYSLKARVKKLSCTKRDEFQVDALDRVAAFIFFSILLLNVIGTVYEVFSKECSGFSLLRCFSIRRNWNKLVDTSEKNASLQNRLNCLDGLRTILLLAILIGHALITSIVNVSNTSVVEKIFDSTPVHSVMNLPITMCCFFFISSFVLAYNLQTSDDNYETWTCIGRRMLKRWCRFTPAYAVALLFIMTWYRHQGDGPFWMNIYKDRIEPCRSIGWYNMLYVNNFVNGSVCMLQGWYLAAEMQLHFLGLFVCIFFKGLSRICVLIVLFIIGLLIPGVLTYIYDLDMQLTPSAELFRQYFLPDPTFRLVYRHSFTNLASYVMGLAMGLLTYKLQKTNFDIQNYKKWIPLYYSAILLNTGIMYSASISYQDRPRLSITTRVIMSAVMKPLLTASTGVLVFGVIFKYERSLCGLLEWRGWTVLNRLGYCCHLINLPFIDYLLGSEALMRTGYIVKLTASCGIVTVTLSLALFLWLLVENPFALITNEVFKDRKHVGNGSISNIVGNGTSLNKVSNGTSSNIVGNGTSSNIVGNGTSPNKVGNGTSSNKVGNDIYLCHKTGNGSASDKKSI